MKTPAKSPFDIIDFYIQNGTHLREKFFGQARESLQAGALLLASTLAHDGKILLCGNGGSAADAQHLAAEFVNRFLMDRPALPAIALTTDTSIISAVANDSEYRHVFSRQLEALGCPGDALVAISTSGKSPNVLQALHSARDKDMYTLALAGERAEEMSLLADVTISVPSSCTPLVQELHIACCHILCRLVDYYLFENPGALTTYLNREEAAPH